MASSCALIFVAVTDPLHTFIRWRWRLVRRLMSGCSSAPPTRRLWVPRVRRGRTRGSYETSQQSSFVTGKSLRNRDDVTSDCFGPQPQHCVHVGPRSEAPLALSTCLGTETPSPNPQARGKWWVGEPESSARAGAACTRTADSRGCHPWRIGGDTAVTDRVQPHRTCRDIKCLA